MPLFKCNYKSDSIPMPAKGLVDSECCPTDKVGWKSQWVQLYLICIAGWRLGNQWW